ncbi:MAG: hypothetical protein RJQ09_21385 [Cyclobacteriaceae bacterium]
MPLEAIYRLRFETAYTYLEQVLGADVFGLHRLPRTSLFWGHWRREWYKIDKAVLNTEEPLPACGHLPQGRTPLLGGARGGLSWDAYKQIHDPYTANYQLNATIIHSHKTVTQ